MNNKQDFEKMQKIADIIKLHANALAIELYNNRDIKIMLKDDSLIFKRLDYKTIGKNNLKDFKR